MIDIDSDGGRVGNLQWRNSQLNPVRCVDWPLPGPHLRVASWGFCFWGRRCLTRGGWYIQLSPLPQRE